MTIKVIRLHDTGDATVGIVLVDGTFSCYCLEDEYREIKVKGETRVPAGEYKVTLRTEGGFHARYKKKFPNMHKGMLWVRNVPNFEYILIHIGNTDENTAGCLLVGETCDVNGFIGRSTDAYKKFYPKVADALGRGEEVTIIYEDWDRD